MISQMADGRSGEGWHSLIFFEMLWLEVLPIIFQVRELSLLYDHYVM